MTDKPINPKQERFCQIYVDTGNASEAYRQAYNSKAKQESVAVNASKLLAKPEIRGAANKLRKERELFLIKSKSVPVDRSTYEAIAGAFNNNQEVEKWASAVLAKAAIELGLDLTVNLRGNINKATRYEVLSRAGFKCQACGESPNPENDVVLHIDHIVPVTIGGDSSENNLQVLCSLCNSSKGNRYAVNHNE